MVANVLLTGVGGQGIITASSVLADACRRAGWQVKKSEVHGMSQRGGSVTSYVRFSLDEPVRSPLIPEGEADIMLAFEPLEGLRQIKQTRMGAKVVVEEERIPPVTVSTGGFAYPEDCLDRLLASGREVTVIEATRQARELGEPRAANTVMLGALASLLELPAEAWEEALKARLKARAVGVNLRAFEVGRELGRAATGKSRAP